MKLPHYEDIFNTPFQNLVMVAVTAAVYLIFLPIDLIVGKFFWCYNRITEKIPKNVEWCIILGCGYIETGMINLRLDTALKLHEENPDVKFFISGTDEGENYSETRYMTNYLRERGLDTDLMHCDGRGFSTIATFLNAKNFGIRRAAIVTSDFHLIRCVIFARMLGIDAYGYPTKLIFRRYRWRYWLRDKFSFYWNLPKIFKLISSDA